MYASRTLMNAGGTDVYACSTVGHAFGDGTRTDSAFSVAIPELVNLTRAGSDAISANGEKSLSPLCRSRPMSESSGRLAVWCATGSNSGDIRNCDAKTCL